MAKKKRRKTPEDVAFDERTKMINDFIQKHREKIEARKAAEQQAEAQSG